MKELHGLYPSLYGNEYTEKDMDERFEALLDKHSELFGTKDAAIFSAAGRTEIAGNHTDHNLGKVIGASINLDTIGAVTKRNDNKVIIASEGFPVCEVDISDLEVKENERNKTESLIRGIAKGFADRGIDVGGWQANTTTRVLKGSGLSSSAAIEVLTAEIFNNLYNDDKLSSIELAKMSLFRKAFRASGSGMLRTWWRHSN